MRDPTQIMHTDLKPAPDDCPLCQSHHVSVMTVILTEATGAAIASIRCSSCGCQITRRAPSGDREKAIRDGVTAWNKRPKISGETADDSSPVATMDDLAKALDVLKPFARAAAKGFIAYQIVDDQKNELRAAGALDLGYPQGPIAVSVAQSNVSWADWDNLLSGYERVRKELYNRLDAERGSSILESISA